MNPEHIRLFYQREYTTSDTGKTDGTTYFPSTLPEQDLDILKRFTAHITDTPGVAGTNTYTLEASNDGVNWLDVTNAWTGSASYTTHCILVPSVDLCARYMRVKRFRSADGANNDGGTAITVRFRY